MKEVTINSLDPSQQYIVDKLTEERADRLSLVYGPPGSGKSHMILSLIFELALQGKKILFSSQNPEALSVIVRKYKDLDRRYGVKDTYLSFLDLCLDLNSMEQAKKTYIRNLRARLKKPIISATKISVGNEAPEILNYTNLDKVENEMASGDLASDEIVRYALEYQGDYSQVPMMISGVKDLDVRKIISLISRAAENFRDYPEEFKLFNEPNNVLLFFNHNNPNLNLGQILERAIRLDSIASSIEGLDGIKNREDSDIKEFLEGISLLVRINEKINIEEVVAKEKSLVDLREDLERIQERKTQFVNVPRLYSHYSQEERERYEKIDSRILNKNNLIELRKFAHDLGTLERYISKTAEMYALDMASDLDWLVGAVAQGAVDVRFIEWLHGQCLKIWNYGFLEIATLIKDIDNWNNLSSIKKLITTVPASFNTNNRSIADKICQRKDIFVRLYTVLRKTNYSIKDFLNIRTYKVNEIVAPFSTNGAGDRAELLNKLLLIQDISRKIALENKSIMGILNEIASLRDQSNLVIKNNFSISGLDDKNIRELVEIVKKNIKNQELSDEIQELENDAREYVCVGVNGRIDITGCLEALKSAEKCDGYLRSFKITKGLKGIDIEVIDDLKREIEETRKTDLFRSDYFVVKSGTSIAQWRSRNSLIIGYNDIKQFNRWIDYNAFRVDLFLEFGKVNERGLNAVFAAGFESFASFARYIVNNLLKFAIFGISLGENIKADYLSTYKNDLKESRRNRYSNGLRKLGEDLRGAADDLSIISNWTMDSNRIKEINKNFDSILEAYPVIIATPGDVAKMIPAKKELFDFVIIDEGSQMLPGAALPLFYRAKHAVVIGDPEQMPPSNAATVMAMDGLGLPQLEPSIIDKTIEANPAEYHLKVHYRSKYNCLFEPSRKIIYSKDGIDPVWEAKGGTVPIRLEDGFGPDSTVGFAKIVRIIDRYTSENAKTNFCIVFARGGKDGPEGFEDYLEEKNLKHILERINNENENEIRLVTVLNCQGITYEHTIHFLPYYTVIKSMYYFKLQAGSYRRANVAITRQTKTHDIVMGNTKSEWLVACNDLIQSSPHDDIKKSARLLSTLFAMANQNTDVTYLHETLGANSLNIDSPLTQQLYDELLKYFGDRIGNELEIFSEVGYKIRIPDEEARFRNEQNVGYRIDLGIYSIKHQKFVLGIEMDGATYHSGFIKEFSDMQRQEILEDKGWELYRIWSTNWRDNLAGEFKALVDVIEEKLAEPVDSELDMPIEIASQLIKGYRAYKRKISMRQISENDNISLLEDATNDEIVDVEESGVSSEKEERMKPDDKLGLAKYYGDLKSCARYCMKMGRSIDLSIRNGRTGGNVSPFQKLIVMNATNDYVEVRYPDSLTSSYFRVYYEDIDGYRA